MNEIVNENQLSVLEDVLNRLEAEHIAYCIINDYALIFQGVSVPLPKKLAITVQWDLFMKAYEIFADYGVGEISKRSGYDCFSFQQNGICFEIECVYNSVVETDHYRMQVEYGGISLWVKSFDYFLLKHKKNSEAYIAIKNYLHMLQKQNSKQNETAWNTEAYQAWINRFGTPEEAFIQIAKDPKSKIKAILPHLGEVKGKKIINLLGSNGVKAISMILLGAEATVVDISKENAQYAKEVSEAGGVNLQYIIADVLNMPDEVFENKYDIVVMELGVLHYFIDLQPLFHVMKKLLKIGGRVVIQDFHPISTKLITSKGKKHKVTGNYFDKTLEVKNVAFSKHLDLHKQTELQKAYLRKWTLGEIVTAVAQEDFMIKLLDEEPNTKIADMGLPKTFTLVAEKI